MEIKKADSKGRVSGFVPGLYYGVERTSSSHVLTSLGVDMVQIAIQGDTVISEEAKLYMLKHGIDPNEVPRDSANSEGYATYVYHEDGRRKFEYGQAVTQPHPWPEGFSWEEFGRLILGAE